MVAQDSFYFIAVYFFFVNFCFFQKSELEMAILKTKMIVLDSEVAQEVSQQTLILAFNRQCNYVSSRLIDVMTL